MAVVWQVMILAATVAATPSEGRDTGSAYAAATTAYRAGDWAAAADWFRQSAHSESTVAPFAWFGFGNARFQQAVAVGTTGHAARAHLDEAIGAYRTVLDGPVVPPLAVNDVRHNIELAKRLRHEIARRANGSRRTAESAKDAEAAVRSATPERSATSDADRPPSETDLSERPTQKDEGIVQKPAAGLPLVDPGRIGRQDAEARLEMSLARIKADERSRRQQSRTLRPRIPGDY